MEAIGVISKAEEKLLAELEKTLGTIQITSQKKPKDLDIGLDILNSLRCSIYENMNQIQHEALILKTANLLQSKHYPELSIKWLWNPRQTGDSSEPDLYGISQDGIAISAEMTTSRKPIGIIDSRMAGTLDKLSVMQSDKYYIVTTEEMERRAKTKINKRSYPITVMRIN